jgi:myosin-crossreactive antigen
MRIKPKAYLVGGGIGSLAAATFMIRDGSLPGGNISVLEAAPIQGGSLDGAVEFKRYLLRFMLEFSRIETLAGVKRTIYNQYDSLVLPSQAWLEAQGVHFVTDCRVTDLDHRTEGGKLIVIGIHCPRQDNSEVIAVNDGDVVFMQNGSMTDASSLGSMTRAWRPTASGAAGIGKSGFHQPVR